MSNTIESICKIKFYKHTFFLSVKTGLNRLLDQNEVVHQLPSLYKSALVVRDDFGEDSFQPVCYHFINNFIPNVS